MSVQFNGTLDSQSWTAAVYFAGGESLNEDMVRGLQEIRAASCGPGDELRALSQFDPKGKRGRFYDFTGENLHRLLKAPVSPVASASPFEDTLTSFEYVIESSDDDVLRNGFERLCGFVETARTSSQEGPLLLVLSGHGSGAIGDFFGHRDLQALQLRELAKALHRDTTHKVELIGMDCCNMGMAEVAYELRDCAEYLIASEGYVPNHGWPYREVLRALSGRVPEDAAIEVVRRYLANYSDYQLLDVSSQCSACELKRIENLVEPTRELAFLLTKRIEEDCWQPIVLAHWEAQSYKDEEYVDLADFCERLSRYETAESVRASCEEVRRVVLDEVVLANGFTGSRFQFSTGLSVYFPWSRDTAKGSSREICSKPPLDAYQELAFSRVTGWGRFLEAYLEGTRRDREFHQRTTFPGAQQTVPVDVPMMIADIRKEKVE
jgi:hypothetical protein